MGISPNPSPRDLVIPNVKNSGHLLVLAMTMNPALNDLPPSKENDLLSELLVQSPLSPGTLREVWTGGMGHRTRRSSLFYWHGSEREWGVDQFRDSDRILGSKEYKGKG